MSIFPLPVFETEADPNERLKDDETYQQIKPPRSLVVRFGITRMVGEFRYDGDITPGCGSKVVARTSRGTELAEMLTTTCTNSGCGKSVTRKEMLDYIDRSGGKSFPFHGRGRILRIATIEDMNRHSAFVNDRDRFMRSCQERADELELELKLVDVEMILGGDFMTYYYMSEDRVDFRDLVKSLAAEYQARIEMRQVGSRDEARLVADYERCGQHCCCKQFLKVLRPVSMRSAKVQKATLDPLKISGRCGRLMCCLRYEDETYKELKAKLPHKKTRVGTQEGPGIVIDSKILTQLVLVELESDRRRIAVPLEELIDPDKCPKPEDRVEPDPFRGKSPERVADRVKSDKSSEPSGDRSGDGAKRGRRGRRRRGKDQQQDDFKAAAQRVETGDAPTRGPGDPDDKTEAGDKPRKRRRRRRGKRSGEQTGADGESQTQASGGSSGRDQSPKAPGGESGEGGAGGGKKRRRRRRRRGKRGPEGEGGGSSGSGESGD